MSFQETTFERWFGEILRWIILGFVVYVPANQAFIEIMPPFEFWLPTKSISWLLGLAFGLVVSFVGQSVMKFPRKYMWALIITGAAYVSFNLWKNADEYYKASNFCYFEALLNDPKPSGGYEWQIKNDQQRKIPFQMMKRYEVIDGKERFIGQWDASTCVPEAVNQTTANEDPIKQGKHIFRWHAENDWEQTLDITKLPSGQLKQIGVIYRGEDEEWRFSNVSR